ncbi:MAG TPA: type IX secretion system plug protein domain-containing protein, partial [Cyclobacteriaceae bacterium]|nr:type IX secretion system plug protein domain-containing protein [Cyclobacteriaceae bacterium]
MFTFRPFCLATTLLALQVNLFAQKELSLNDKVYEAQIKSVQLYPNMGGAQDFLQPSAAAIDQQSLLLEFDDLQDQRSNYYAKLIHCNYDWTKSQLMDLDFMSNYNEYPFTDYQMSSNTHVRYIHYRLQVPQVKLPGNYVLVVYRDDASNIILSRRMMVFDSQIG